MDLKKQLIFVTTLAIVLPSLGQLPLDTATRSIPMVNTSVTEAYKSEVQICRDYQCTGREQCAAKGHDSFVCNCDRECALYRDCCWTADGYCKDRIKWNAGVTTTEICTYTQTTAWYTSQAIRVGHFMIATCPSHYPANYVMDRCQKVLPLFSKQPYSLEEYIHHVPVFSYKNKRTYKNFYCAKCNGVEYKDMRFWQFITICDSRLSTSECDGVTFEPRPGVYNTTVPRKCVISDVNNCSSSSPFYEQCTSYSAVTTYNGMTFRNPHCALCYDPALSFSEKEICPDNVDLETNLTEHIFPEIVSSIPHVVPFDFSIFEETNVPFKNATCSRGLFYNSSSEVCDFDPESTVISLTDCSPISYSEITLKFELNSANLSNWHSTKMKEYLKDATSRYFSTSNISYLGRQDDILLLNLRLQDSFTFENFYQAANRFVQDLMEYHGLSIELFDIVVNCSFSSTSTSCQETSRFRHSDVVLFTHDDITSAKIESLNRVYSDISWDISSQGICTTDNHTCERNITVTICDWQEEYPLCPFLILTNNSFSLEENDNGTTHLMSDVIEGAVPQYNYVILSNGNACVCLEHLKEKEYLIILILFVVFTSLSLLTLLLTFVTYGTFESLRNLPGKITMNFVVSLFFAQIILIPSSFPTINYGACQVIGIFGHYLWLSTFLWMSVIAFDVSRTFGLKSSTLNHVTNNTRTFIIYLFVGWVVPCVYVAMCVIIQISHIYNLEFAYLDADEKCWLSPDRANFILFGIPAILCLCFNYVTFIFTVRGLHRSKVNSKMVNNQMSSHDIMKEEIFLLLKISILMGLSWIWGILYGLFQDFDIFLYLHSILNPLQGFFVFCIYVCNKRVLFMWRSILRKRFDQSDKSKGRDTKSTTYSSSKSMSEEPHQPHFETSTF